MATMFFKDQLSAWHKEKAKQPDGSTTERTQAQPFLDAVPCQISFLEDDKASPKTKEGLPQKHIIKVFILTKHTAGQSFRRGDLVTVSRASPQGQSETYQGTIGQPKLYTRGLPHIELTFEDQP